MRISYCRRSSINSHTYHHFLILLFLLPILDKSQQSSDSLAPGNISIKFLQISQPYEIFSPSFSGGQVLQSWLWRNGVNYWPEFQLELDESFLNLQSGKFADFNNYSTGIYNYPGLDYRGTSYYLPENVREYIDFKMGREPYLPVFNPVLLGFILYNLRYYLLQNEQENSVQGELNVVEVKLLQILLQNSPLNEQEWYEQYRQTNRDSLFSMPSFQKAVERLRKKSLVLLEFTENRELKYYPSTNAPNFYLRSRP